MSPDSRTPSEGSLCATDDGKDSGCGSPNPLDDELEICLKSVEEAMASLQDTVKKNNTQREAGAATMRPQLNRSFEVSSIGARSGDWRRRSCDGMELEMYGREKSWNKQSHNQDCSRIEHPGPKVSANELVVWICCF